MSKAGFSFDTRSIIAFIEALKRRSHGSIINAGQQSADKMVQYAKENARWTDRTGNARRTIAPVNLFGEPDSKQANYYYIGVCGNMPYSVSLELGHSGKYAILQPTVDKFAYKITDEIRNAISRQEGVEVH